MRPTKAQLGKLANCEETMRCCLAALSEIRREQRRIIDDLFLAADANMPVADRPGRTAKADGRD